MADWLKVGGKLISKTYERANQNKQKAKAEGKSYSLKQRIEDRFIILLVIEFAMMLLYAIYLDWTIPGTSYPNVMDL